VPAAGRERPRGGERPFRRVSAGERGNAEDDRISPSRNTPARHHIADRVPPSVSDYANAFITNDGLQKRV
jgi:hypothetical protein